MNSNRDTLKVLKKMRLYLKLGWTQGRSAKNIFGNYCSPSSVMATQFCLFGALCRATSERDDYAFGCSPSEALYLACPEMNDFGIVGWNDALGRKKEEVLAVVEKAITMMEAQHDVH